MAARLLSDAVPDPDRITGSAETFVLRETGCASMAELPEALEARQDRAGAVIDAALARVPEGRDG